MSIMWWIDLKPIRASHHWTIKVPKRLLRYESLQSLRTNFSLDIARARYSTQRTSSVRWQSRQKKDIFSRDARIQGFRSRAAYKLLEMDRRYKIFRDGQTIVDLGYAPGSWSQVALDKSGPRGRVIGIDILPSQPLKGVLTIQGDFLDAKVREELQQYLFKNGKDRIASSLLPTTPIRSTEVSQTAQPGDNYLTVPENNDGVTEKAISSSSSGQTPRCEVSISNSGGLVDVVLSDMMTNTSGNLSRDHIRSMDLCNSALEFAFGTLRIGGAFICKFYQGADEKLLERRLRLLFQRVHREKPQSSRAASREAYYVALHRKPDTEIVTWFRQQEEYPIGDACSREASHDLMLSISL